MLYSETSLKGLEKVSWDDEDTTSSSSLSPVKAGAWTVVTTNLHNDSNVNKKCITLHIGSDRTSRRNLDGPSACVKLKVDFEQAFQFLLRTVDVLDLESCHEVKLDWKWESSPEYLFGISIRCQFKEPKQYYWSKRAAGEKVSDVFWSMRLNDGMRDKLEVIYNEGCLVRIVGNSLDSL